MELALLPLQTAAPSAHNLQSRHQVLKLAVFGSRMLRDGGETWEEHVRMISVRG